MSGRIPDLLAQIDDTLRTADHTRPLALRTGRAAVTCCCSWCRRQGMTAPLPGARHPVSSTLPWRR